MSLLNRAPARKKEDVVRAARAVVEQERLDHEAGKEGGLVDLAIACAIETGRTVRRVADECKISDEAAVMVVLNTEQRLSGNLSYRVSEEIERRQMKEEG